MLYNRVNVSTTRGGTLCQATHGVHSHAKKSHSVSQLTCSKRCLAANGARGPGKTTAGIVWPLYDISNPLLRVLVIRHNADDLSDWLDRAQRMYARYEAVFTGQPATIRFPSGAVIKTGHLKDDQAYTKYQGHEYQRVLIEELTQIPSEKRYLMLISSCRSTVPELPAQVFLTTNPGGPGHGWVKKRFIDPAPPETPFVDPVSGRKRIFIPATIDDNPVLTKVDPAYVTFLDSLKETDEQLWKAWRLGDWDVFAGQAFREFLYNQHVISRLEYKLSETKNILCMDWGYNHHGAVYWMQICPENAWGVKRIVTYRELYQNGKTPAQWADDILDLTPEPVDYIVLPHDAFAHKDGNRSIAEVFKSKFANQISVREGKTLTAGANISRVAVSHELLSMAPDGKPYTQIHQNCSALIRTLPNLIYDDKRPEIIDKGGLHEDDNNDDCLAGDTFVLTTSGEIPIRELVGRTGYIATPYGPKRFYGVHSKGVRPVYRFTFEHTFIDATADHKALTANGEWKSLVDLRRNDLIPYVYEGLNPDTDQTAVQWDELLQDGQVLPAVLPDAFSFTSSDSMGIPQWSDPYGLSYSSQGPRSREQPGRESGGSASSTTSVVSFETSSSSGANEEAGRTNTPTDQGMARLGRGQSLAQSPLREDERKITQGPAHQNLQSSVRDLRPTVHGQAPESEALLSNVLVSVRVPQSQIQKVEYLGEQEVFDLTVEDIHCLVANGMIVSNCYDGWSLGLLTITDGQSWIVDPKPPEGSNPQGLQMVDGNMTGFSLDRAAIIRRQGQRSSDWKHR